jgi:hypothetical protein
MAAPMRSPLRLGDVARGSSRRNRRIMSGASGRRFTYKPTVSRAHAYVTRISGDRRRADGLPPREALAAVMRNSGADLSDGSRRLQASRPRATGHVDQEALGAKPSSRPSRRGSGTSSRSRRRWRELEEDFPTGKGPGGTRRPSTGDRPDARRMPGANELPRRSRAYLMLAPLIDVDAIRVMQLPPLGRLSEGAWKGLPAFARTSSADRPPDPRIPTTSRSCRSSGPSPRRWRLPRESARASQRPPATCSA